MLYLKLTSEWRLKPDSLIKCQIIIFCCHSAFFDTSLSCCMSWVFKNACLPFELGWVWLWGVHKVTHLRTFTLRLESQITSKVLAQTLECGTLNERS